VLFDYMSRELGQGRSDLVREHLRRCEECQRAAAEIQQTLDLLHEASVFDRRVSAHLTDRRRDRVWRAFVHPVIHWIEVHHIAVSIAVAILVLAAVLFELCRARILREEPIEGIPVVVGEGEEARVVFPPPGLAPDTEEAER
jgi:anti-sigma factor RsiW